MNDRIENIVRDNVNEALEQADELLKKAANASDDTAKELQEEAKKKLRMARETLGNFYQNASNQSKEIADGINACVHENPWRAVGIAAAAGVLLGLLIAKK